MDETLYRFFRWAQESWTRKSTLLVVLAVVPGIWLYLAAQWDFSGDISPIEWLIGLGFFPVIIAVWLFTNRIPRVRRDHIGFVLAISTENESEAAELRRDFIHALRERLGTLSLQSPIHLVVYHAGLAAEVHTKEDALRSLERSRGKIMVYGQAKRRAVQGTDQQVLDLRLIARHAPIGPQTQAVLAREMNEVFLPQGFSFERQDALRHFWFTAEWMDLAVRYVAGLAALVSGDFDCAEEMLRSVDTRLHQSLHATHPQFAKIRSKLPTWILEINLHRLHRQVEEFVRTRDRQYLRDAEPVIAQIEKLGGEKNYGVCLCKAICLFLFHRDIQGARRALRRADPSSKKKDATWRFSEAFLYAYTGDLDKAVPAYFRAFNQALGQDDIHLQTEEFIEEVLAEEPDKVQLHFCLGLINFHAKEDMAAASRNMKKFLSTAELLWPTQRQTAEEYVKRAEARLKREEARQIGLLGGHAEKARYRSESQ